MDTSGDLSTIFDPGVFKQLQEIFDSTWQAIEAQPEQITPEQADRRRNDLAQMIILAHKSGMSLEQIENEVLGRFRPTRTGSRGSTPLGPPDHGQ